MPVIIKEIQVKTTVAKKMFLPEGISSSEYAKLKAEIVEELRSEMEWTRQRIVKKER